MMTKEEITKALEICIDPKGRCSECPFKRYPRTCKERLGIYILEILKGDKND